jgi:signal transduction histidine kinase
MREFGVLKNSFRDAAEQLEAARRSDAERIRNQSWAEMAQKVAHELKNPLTPMRMAAERVAVADDPSLAEAGEVLREEILHLDALARTFSQFGRPPEGPTSTVDLAELLSTLRRRLTTAEVPIELDLPEGAIEVNGHLGSLERVLRNLLANAHDATHEASGFRPGAASIEVVARAMDTGVEIRVLDRGPGIPDALLPRIWQPDFTSKRRGTGLGLPMVRQAIRAHGGEVWAGNRDGGGAEFIVRLPYGSTLS